MRPEKLNPKIFLDSGDPKETKDALDILGFLDGQTTNPTLIAKNPSVHKRIEDGNYFSKDDIYENYKTIAEEISSLIPQGSISLEVYADDNTKAAQMLEQARKMFCWIPNAHIKLPIIPEGLKASEQAVKEGIRINMTLCFTQEQAAAVYGATKGAKKGDVFISPFMGRFDDLGYNGLDLTKNMIEMYKDGDGHVEVLAASVRNIDHLLTSIYLDADIITSPFKVLQQWVDEGMQLPDENFKYEAGGLKEIPYKQLSLDKPWQEFKFQHELLDKGLKRFADDWNNLTGE